MTIIERLRQTTTALAVPERARVSYLKMYLNYIAQSVDSAGTFLRDMRLARTEAELCEGAIAVLENRIKPRSVHGQFQT